MTKLPLSKVKDHLSALVKKAASNEIVITSHGRAVGVLRGFATEEDYLEYRLLNDPRFKKMIAASRKEFRQGKVTRIEDI